MNRNTEYEQFVRDMSQHLLKADGLENVVVEHDVKLRGVSGQEHQIDVHWEFKLGGIRHRVALECKNYSAAISIGKVRDFHSVLRDVPHLEGAMVTRVGFQSGAVRYAEAHGIGLKIIRPVESSDWEGRIRSIHATIRMVTPVLEQVRVHVDRQWVETYAAGIPPEEINRWINQRRDDSLFSGTPPVPCGETLNEKLNEIVNRLPVLDLTDDDAHQDVSRLQGYSLGMDDRPPLPLTGVEITYRRKESTGPEIYSESAARNIIKDVLTGQLLFVDEDGRLSGDTGTSEG